MSEDSPSPETSSDSESTLALGQEVERLQQRIDELEGGNKPSRSSALWTSVFTFLTLFFLWSLFQISMVYCVDDSPLWERIGKIVRENPNRLNLVNTMQLGRNRLSLKPDELVLFQPGDLPFMFDIEKILQDNDIQNHNLIL